MTKSEWKSGHKQVGATRPDGCDQGAGVNEWVWMSGCEWVGMNKWEQQGQMGVTREWEWMSGHEQVGATTRLDGCDQEVGMKPFP